MTTIHELDVQGSLTALLLDWPGCTWLTSDKAELLWKWREIPTWCNNLFIII